MRKIIMSTLLIAIIGMNVYGEGQENSLGKKELFGKLSDENVNITDRLEAAKALCHIGDERALDYLLEFLKYEDKEVHKQALQYINFYWKGNKRIVGPVIEVLDYEDPSTRAVAVSCLGRQLDKRAIEPLIRKLTDKDEKVKSSAASALCRITFLNFNKVFSYEQGTLTGKIEDDPDKWQEWWNNNRNSIDSIMITRRMELLRNKKAEIETRRIAIEDLVQLGATDTMRDALVNILQDSNEDKHLRESILGILATTEQIEGTLPVCLKIVKGRYEEPSTRAIAIAALPIDDNRTIALLIQIVRNRNENLRVRRMAAGGLLHASAKNQLARDVIDQLMKDKHTDKSIKYYIRAVQKKKGK